MINKFLFFISLIIILNSCTNQVFIDNPKSTTINVKIDEKNYEIKAFSNLKIKLKNGIHSVSSFSENGDTLLIKNIDISEEGLLNVTQEKYTLWTDIYCNESDYDKLKSNLSLKDTVKVDNIEFINIDFEILTDDFIPKTWDFDIDQKMPNKIDLSKNENFIVKSKIFRSQEIKDEFNYLGDIDFNGMSEEEINKTLENRTKK